MVILAILAIFARPKSLKITQKLPIWWLVGLKFPKLSLFAAAKSAKSEAWPSLSLLSKSLFDALSDSHCPRMVAKGLHWSLEVCFLEFSLIVLPFLTFWRKLRNCVSREPSQSWRKWKIWTFLNFGDSELFILAILTILMDENHPKSPKIAENRRKSREITQFQVWK